MKMEWTAGRRLALSALAGILAAGGVSHHLRVAQRRMAAGVLMDETLVARRYVAAGKPLAPADLEARRIPRAYIEPGALRRSEEALAGRARVSLLKGEQLTRSKVDAASGRCGVAWVIAPGSRALGLRLPTENAVAGHLQPGDRVDVMAIPQREGASPRVVAARVRVLSVGERLWDPGEAAADAAAASGAAESLLLSLDVTPEETLRLAAAVARETITLALTSPLGETAGTSR